MIWFTKKGCQWLWENLTFKCVLTSLGSVQLLGQHAGGKSVAGGFHKNNRKMCNTGVPQYCIHFCFLNFSVSYWRRNTILDIFQQPISCRFWKYPILYYSVKYGPRYWQNTTGRSFQKLTFFVFYSMKQFSIHELSWVPMSTHVWLWELKSAQESAWVLNCFIKQWTKNVNFYNDLPVVFCQYLGPCFTEL